MNVVSVSVTIKSLKEEKAAASIRYKKISFVFKQDAVTSSPSCSNRMLCFNGQNEKMDYHSVERRRRLDELMIQKGKGIKENEKKKNNGYTMNIGAVYIYKVLSGTPASS